MYLSGNVIHTFLLEYKKNEPEAKLLRSKFIMKTEFPFSTEANSRLIYLEFKSLPYKKQIDQEGMAYLFSAWSHDIFNKGFLKEMIQFLERGKGNFNALKPLYGYAYQRYGNSFSKHAKYRKLKASQRVKSGIKKELDAELEAARKELTPVEVDNLSPEQRMDYYLQEAKDAAPEGTTESDTLIMD